MGGGREGEKLTKRIFESQSGEGGGGKEERMLNPERTEQLKTWRNGRSTSCVGGSRQVTEIIVERPVVFGFGGISRIVALSAAIRARLVGVVLARNKWKRKLLRLMERGNLCWFSLGTRRLASRYLRKGISLVQHPKRGNVTLSSLDFHVRFLWRYIHWLSRLKTAQVTYDTSSKRYPAPFGLWQRWGTTGTTNMRICKKSTIWVRVTAQQRRSFGGDWSGNGGLMRLRSIPVPLPTHLPVFRLASAAESMPRMLQSRTMWTRGHGAVKWGDLRANSSSWCPSAIAGTGIYTRLVIIVIFGASDYTGKCKGASRLRLRRSLRSETHYLANSVLIPSPFPSTIIIQFPSAPNLFHYNAETMLVFQIESCRHVTLKRGSFNFKPEYCHHLISFVISFKYQSRARLKYHSSSRLDRRHARSGCLAQYSHNRLPPTFSGKIHICVQALHVLTRPTVFQFILLTQPAQRAARAFDFKMQ
ncbi:hypothetical protein R3P38DRAFT_2762312 [Favolaschia claudopus]|uniref:Uncharacterized protein n=1 Tax=Favolaschia claudopus TaxID=2862362 RepID=A0AAW0DIK9_9AGAR